MQQLLKTISPLLRAAGLHRRCILADVLRHVISAHYHECCWYSCSAHVHSSAHVIRGATHPVDSWTKKCACRTRTRGPFDFGSPIRRVTDVLLVVNCACFAAQWLTRDALTIWGAKVRGCQGGLVTGVILGADGWWGQPWSAHVVWNQPCPSG